MQIVFKTEPAFLRTNFDFLRQSLLGQWNQSNDPTLSHYRASFSFKPQPVITLSRGENTESITLEVVKDKASTEVKTVIEDKENGGFWSDVVNWALGFLMLGATISLLVMYGPKLYYSIVTPQSIRSKPDYEASAVGGDFSAGTGNHDEEVGQEATQSAEVDGDNSGQRRRYLPDVNENLPEGDWLIIPRIGVNTPLQDTEVAEEALDTGVWWVPEFGLPGELDYPMIVAGHRYGWKWWWKTDYWTYHSFYKLPELEAGDEVKVISEQREWIYEIYASQEGEEITDYQADLILYTCKFLNSPIRYFKYARLVNIE